MAHVPLVPFWVPIFDPQPFKGVALRRRKPITLLSTFGELYMGTRMRALDRNVFAVLVIKHGSAAMFWP